MSTDSSPRYLSEIRLHELLEGCVFILRIDCTIGINVVVWNNLSEVFPTENLEGTYYDFFRAPHRMEEVMRKFIRPKEYYKFKELIALYELRRSNNRAEAEIQRRATVRLGRIPRP